MLTYKNNLAQVSLYDGGGGPSPVTPPSYSFQGGNLVGGSQVTIPSVSPTGSNFVGPNTLSYAANVVQVGAAAGGGSYGGVTDEGVVIGNPNVNNSTFGNSYGANITPVSAPAPQKVDLSYNANTEANTPATETTSTPTPATPAPEASPPSNTTAGGDATANAPTDSYLEYLQGVPDELKDIYTDAIAGIDAQNKQLVDEINGIRNDAIAAAGTQKESDYAAAETIKNNAYTYADQALMAALGFNQEQYDRLLASINAAKESGMQYAEETKQILLSLSEETKAAVYAAAEAARVREYEQADIARQRGIVDASSAYEQNKSTYGANAEALASMGLTGGGYSDYLNAQAYAAQRGEVQAVNADAEAAKRAARYAEDEKKLEADATYAENVANAESKYADTVYAINTTYNENLTKANQDKAAADYAANSANRDAKYEADQTYAGNIYAADSSYNASVADANKEADERIADANYNAASERNEAEISYKTGLAENEKDIAVYQQKKADEAEAEAKAEKAYADEMFGVLLGGANTGEYNADQLASLADTYGLSPEQKQALIDSAAAYEQKKEEAKATDSSVNYKDVVANSQYDPSYYTQEDYDDMAKNDVLTADDAAKAKAEQNRNVYNGVVDMLNSGNVDNIAGAFADADALYRDGNIDKATYDEITALLNNSSQGVTYQYKSGKLTASQYVEKMRSIGAASSNTVSGGWFIEGLGTGRENDDVDITLGSTSRNKDTEFDLLCGATVTDSATINALNKLATGSASKTPSIDGEGSGWFFGVGADTSISSDDKPGKIVCYNGNLYLYGKKNGWVKLKSDNDQGTIDKAVAAFLESAPSSKIKGKTAVTYPSDSEIAQKADSGTLTYEDVAKYNPGIRTKTEFARGNNSDKQKYGTYQAYLKAMYEKYAK
ncbi:MAG: hypothetical protein IJV72_08310 [Clostridia bacterium]|nr:hypothetical protein [Clostridia bacterium]